MCFQATTFDLLIIIKFYSQFVHWVVSSSSCLFVFSLVYSVHVNFSTIFAWFDWATRWAILVLILFDCTNTTNTNIDVAFVAFNLFHTKDASFMITLPTIIVRTILADKGTIAA